MLMIVVDDDAIAINNIYYVDDRRGQ